MPKLSDDQKQKYLSICGVHCPYCGSEDIQGEAVEINEGEAAQEVNCNQGVDVEPLGQLPLFDCGEMNSAGSTASGRPTVAMGHIHMGAWHWTRTVTCTARRLAAAILAPSAAPTTAVSSTRSRHNVPVLIAAHIARNPEKESWADCLCNGDFSTAISASPP